MTEEIINALTHVESLKVIARTSSFAFKGQQVDIRSIGRQLDVEILLEGSLRRAGNKLRITAQLIKVSDGTHIWSERYEWKWEEAEKEFKMALELSPNYPTAHQWYAIYLSSLGRFEESLDQINRALQLDPLSVAINLAKGILLYNAQQLDEALKQLQKTSLFNNKIPAVYFFTLLIHFAQDRNDKAVKEHLD